MTRLLACGVLLLAGGCHAPAPRLNAPPHGTAENVSEMQQMYTHMIDNALLADMTVADIHFVPHRPLLNGLGEERLTRLAGLLELYGGEIRFNSDLTDSALVQGRVQAVVEFLRELGVDTATQRVAPGLPGGRGLESREVVLIKLSEGTYRPAQQGESPPPPMGSRR